MPNKPRRRRDWRIATKQPDLPSDRTLVKIISYRGQDVSHRPYRAFYEPVTRHLTKEHTWQVIKTGPAREMFNEAETLNELVDRIS